MRYALESDPDVHANFTYEPKQHNMTEAQFLSVARIQLYTLCALDKCEKICASHSYREADDHHISDLFELFRETDTLKRYGESRTIFKKRQIN